MYLYSGKKIKLTIQFNENVFSFEIDPYDPVFNIKKIICSIYPDIQLNQYDILYQNKSISHLIDKKQSTNDNELIINDYFKRKKEINIILKKKILNLTHLKTTSDIDNDIFICSSCINSNINNNISLYCTDCNAYMCQKCKTLKHANHKSIFFKPEKMEDSIKLYSIQLQADISDKLNKYREIDTLFKNNVLIDFYSWKEIFSRKLEKVGKIFDSFQEFNARFQKKLENVENLAMETSQNIEKIVDELSLNLLGNNNNKSKQIKISQKFENLKNIMNQLNQNQNSISQIDKEIHSRSEEFSINKKINDIFSQFEKHLDDLDKLCNDSYSLIKQKVQIYEIENNLHNKKINLNGLLKLAKNNDEEFITLNKLKVRKSGNYDSMRKNIFQQAENGLFSPINRKDNKIYKNLLYNSIKTCPNVNNKSSYRDSVTNIDNNNNNINNFLPALRNKNSSLKPYKNSIINNTPNYTINN